MWWIMKKLLFFSLCVGTCGLLYVYEKRRKQKLMEESQIKNLNEISLGLTSYNKLFIKEEENLKLLGVNNG